MKRILPIIMILITLSGCAIGASTYTESFFAMDTYMTITVNGKDAENAVKSAEAEIKTLDKKLSAHNKESEIYKLNKNGSAELSEDSADLIKKSLGYYKLTGGAFNFAMLDVTRLWGFPDKNYRVPEKSELEKALKTAKPDMVKVNGKKVSLGLKGISLDLGAVAKGYTSQKITDNLKKWGIDSALLNLGGNVQVLGTKPDGSLWTVAVENPDKDKEYLGTLKIKDMAVVTSGGYERCFKKNGKTYHHILNPENGYPAESGLVSATAVCENGALADAFSTALFVMGKGKAERFWADSKESFDIILYTDKKELIISEGLESGFSSDMKYRVIKRSDYE